MRKVLRSGGLALIGLAAAAAPVLAPRPPRRRQRRAATRPTRARSQGRSHVPGPLPRADHRQGTLPGLGSLPRRRACATPPRCRRPTGRGYADTNDTYNSVASSWTEPTVNCAQQRRRPGRSRQPDQRTRDVRLPPRRPERGRRPSGSASTATPRPASSSSGRTRTATAARRPTTPGTRCTRTPR